MSRPPAVGPDLETRVSKGVLHITLARPDKLNALTRPMLDGLELLVRWSAAEPAVRAVMLSGKGSSFCAGDDRDGLGAVLGVRESEITDAFDAHQRVVQALLKLRKPVVAALHGAVFGAALDIALACDLRVADPTTILGPVYSALGFTGGTAMLPFYVGAPRARRILLMGEPISSEEGFEIGLLDFPAEPGQAVAAGRKLANRLAGGPTVALGLIKSTILMGAGSGLLESLHLEEQAILESLLTADAKEGIRALQERRAPLFRGR